ncbi:DUF3040 domain-containing protein [Actinosynnema sp. NPDC059797]
MRWSLWVVLVGLLFASLARIPPVAVLATGLVTAGYGARRRRRTGRPRTGTGARPHGAVRTRTVVLGEREQRLFRSIEERLAAEDPGFARRLRALDRAGRREEGLIAAAVVLAPAVAVIALLDDPALAVVAALVTAIACWVRLPPSAPRRPRRAPGPDEPLAPGTRA